MVLIHAGYFFFVLGMCMQSDVLLPQSEGPHRVLWLLHGASDDETAWQRRTSIERYVEGTGLAVVMPCGHLSSYVNMAHGGKYFSYIADELPTIMRGFFSLSDKREDNFIAGLSMGGAGALRIGIARPENYCAIGCFSASVDNRRRDMPGRTSRRYGLTYGDAPIEGTEKDTRGNVHKLLQSGKPVPRIYHACGTEDFLLENARETKAFFESLEGNPFDYQYEETPGAHTWDFWDARIQDFLRYIHVK